MRDELEQKLVKRYPKLYADYGGDIRVTCMGWGFECGDGWFDLLNDLSAKLEPMIEEFIAANPDEYPPKASQVKEKFGTLRFYMDGATSEMYDLINKAEEISEITCEACGQPGTIRGRGWISVRCDKCNERKES